MARRVRRAYCRRMRSLVLVIGSLGVAACWSSSSPKPVSNESSSEREIAVVEAEDVDGSPESPGLARKQAIEQARAAGILGKASVTPAPTPTPAPQGPLGQESIRREVRARMGEIRLCYEQRLVDEPTLQGTTRVTFTIGSDGSVLSSTGTGFDPAVDTCVADVIKAIRFPAPDGGGTMRVNYPFIFRPADP